MKTTGRIAPLIVAAGLLAGACTGSSDAKSGGGRGPSGTSPTPIRTVVAPPGTTVFVYSNADVFATMRLRGQRGTLRIQNKTGLELPPPGFYILAAADGHRVDGTVAVPDSIPDGQTKSFRVSFAGLQVKDIGLVILVMGEENFGAFVPQ